MRIAAMVRRDQEDRALRAAHRVTKRAYVWPMPNGLVAIAIPETFAHPGDVAATTGRAVRMEFDR